MCSYIYINGRFVIILLRLRRQRQSRHKRLHYYVIGAGQKVCICTRILCVHPMWIAVDSRKI